MDIESIMQEMYNICKNQGIKNYMIQYIPDEELELDDKISAILFTEDIEQGNNIQKQINNELSNEIYDVCVEKDDDGFAYCYEKNVQVWVTVKKPYIALNGETFLMSEDYEPF